MGLGPKQKNKEPRICQCGCGKTFYPFPMYRNKKDGGGLRYPKYIRGHYSKLAPKRYGKIPAWNKGMKKGDHPALEKMGFQKGHPAYYIAPRTKIYRIDPRASRKYRTFCAKIHKRDKYTCQLCGDHNYKGRGGSIKLEVDHIVPISVDVTGLYDESNVRTLCNPCHRKTETYGGRMKRLKKKHLELSDKK